MASADTSSAVDAGQWQLGDLTVNRIGFGAMRLTGSAAFHRGVPSDRERVLSVLRRATTSTPRRSTSPGSAPPTN
jgi:pyridoxine 4-dehydrogenase